MKFLLTLFLSAHSFLGWSQTFVPDANFEQVLIDLGLDSGTPNGFVPTANIDTVTQLDISNGNIALFTGIQDFTSLQRFEFLCLNVQSADLSQNLNLVHLDCKNFSALPSSLTTISLPPFLEYLDLSYNESISGLDLTSLPNLKTLKLWSIGLSSIDLTQNVNLEYLNVGFNQLATIDLSQNSSLTFLGVGSNDLTTLNVSQNVSLEMLFCKQNQLTDLDLSANTLLNRLACGGNLLTTLNLSNNPLLQHVSCDYNDLTELDLSFTDSLTFLDCTQNNITDIVFGTLDTLQDLRCDYNQLTELDLTSASKMGKLSCRFNQLNSLTLPPVSNLGNLSCSHNQLTALDLSGIPENWSSINCSSNQLMCLKLSPSVTVELFSAANNPNLTCLEIPGGNPPTGPWTTNPTISIDPQMSFSSSCGNPCVTSVDELMSEDKKILRITDLMGREVQGTSSNQVLIYIYEDGSIERVFQME